MSTGFAHILAEIPMEEILQEIRRRDLAAAQPHPRAASWAMPVLLSVSEEFNRTIPEILFARRRYAEDVLMRQYVMALLEEIEPSRPLEAIGKLFGQGYHNVIHARRKIEDIRDTDKSESLRWDRLLKASREIASRRSARQVISAPSADQA